MAEDTSNQTKSESKYTIDFLEGKFTLTLGEMNGEYGELTEVSFHKEIYQPGCVEFKVQVGTKTQGSCKGSVDLKYGVDIVAKNYYIFEKVTKGEYVTYKAYSADKFLTIDKFNMAHRGKRLVNPLLIDKKSKAGGIVYTVLGLQSGTKPTKSISNFKSLIDNSNQTPWVKKLNHIGESTDDSLEAVIPYCVQYNESFLDFMVRICNRYGEFLYCEENKWHIGLETNATGKDISAISASSSAKYESCITDFKEETVFLNPNYLDSECDDNKVYSQKDSSQEDSSQEDSSQEDSLILKKSDGAFSQEYFEPIGNKDYAQLSDYVAPLSTTFDLLKSAAEHQNLFEALSATAVATSFRLGIAGKLQHDVNTKYKKKYYGKLLDDSLAEDKNKKYEFTRDSKQVNAEFYAQILEGEEKAERSKLELEYSTYTHLLLGQKVIYNNENYVVYHVEAGKEKDTEEYQVVVLVPEVDGKFYPLPMKQLHIRKASPQRAVVVNNFDPERLGRVQVKYPWQPETAPETADATPWLRVCYPMASNESGFMFFPKEGDEVLIDYEEGNIERPFVAGSFYSKTNPPSGPSSTHTVGVVKSIASDNGHHISFTDLSGGYKFLSDLIPFVNVLSKFGLLSSPCLDDDSEEESTAEEWTDWGRDLRKYLAGGFEIADYLGVYSITGSTHERNITISSPVGDVIIDAFTGITINAPHGDVKILGKNVDIEARNNLTIQSGTNIKKPYFTADWKGKKAWGQSVMGVLALPIGVLKFAGCDLSFQRTCLEVFFRPIGGTMLVKSHRFMQLEAGDGVTYLSKTRDKKKGGKLRKLLTRSAFAAVPTDDIIKNEIGDIKTRVVNAFTKVNEIIDLIGKVKNETDSFKGKINALQASLDKQKVINYCLKWCNNAQRGTFSYPEIGEGIVKKVESVAEKLDLIKNTWSATNWKLKNSNEWTTVVEKTVGDEMVKFNGGDWAEKLQIVSIKNIVTVKRKCLFEEIKHYVENNNAVKDVISMDDSNINFSNLNEVKNAVKKVVPKALSFIGKLFSLEKHDSRRIDLINKVTGLEGLYDDNVWSSRDKGGILISADKDHYFNLANDGTFKPGDYTVYNVIQDSFD